MTQRTKYEAGLSWCAAENIATWRRHAGLSGEALAARVSELGVPMNRSVLTNIERHRREALTVEEVVAFALALNVPPVELLLPHQTHEDERAGVEVSDKSTAPLEAGAAVNVVPAVEVGAFFVRGWLRGVDPLPVDLPNDRWTEAGREEFHRYDPLFARRDRQARRHPVMRAIHELEVFVRDAAADEPPADGGISPELLAEALRDRGRRLQAYLDLLAEDIERSDER